MPLASLLPPTTTHKLQPEALARVVEKAYLLSTAISIHTTITRCNDQYLREVLALTARQDSVKSMADLNVDTASGLDLCITSWAVLPIFDEGGESDLGMGLGLPDYVRKPWSRDAGGCIILPRDRRGTQGMPRVEREEEEEEEEEEGGLEVLVQLKTGDMERLRADCEFMACVARVID